ncbi:MAG: 3-hydroxyacyl-[acyl-carrier-protein] dehydratase FabZ [Candidatus Brocadia sp. UTAMX2]|jgi:beta-hydroxyacyl-ACP dehydratase FabZ|nr:MAG: 3-hydroxyacyl-[acyl-carrier-protein] dehydratase FabZ [Candidatus Brocadia sp. UTAMX2]
MTVSYPPPRAILPHSYPFLLIDRILKLDEGKHIVCLKNVTINEEFFQGHFKNNPVMPGSLIIEAMAQTSGLMMIKENSRMAYLCKIKDAKFRKMVVPGDQLIITSSLIDKFPPFYAFEVVASVGSEIVSEAEITLSLS